MPRRIGITTTVPVEIIYATGRVPVDLNNVFITHENPNQLLENAERDGFASGVCAWIKGIWSAAKTAKVENVVVVVHGDCANTIALGEVFDHKKIPVTPFAFPHRRDRRLLADAIDDFAERMGAKKGDIEKWKSRLDQIRGKLVTLDDMTWKTGQVTGEENHLFLVSSSDFGSDPDVFEKTVDEFLVKATKRPVPVEKNALRLGILGVPTILSNRYSELDSLGGKVVFNEVQRQFSMPSLALDLPSQYANYTYPFDLEFRIQDILEQTKKRKIKGLIHYVQSFCHRQIEDIVLRQRLGVPLLTIEGDRPGPVDGRTLTRIEAFMEMLRGD